MITNISTSKKLLFVDLSVTNKRVSYYGGLCFELGRSYDAQHIENIVRLYKQ